MKTEYSLEKCIKEAKNFIDAAEDALEDIKGQSYYKSSRLSAAAKRRSMDLSECLIELRKSTR